MHRLFLSKLLPALLAGLTLSLSAHPHHGEMPDNARPHTVRIEFNLSLSVEEKAAVLAGMEKQFPGVKHLSSSLNPKANFRELRIPPDWSINQALSALKKVEGVVQVAPVIVQPGSYDPTSVILTFAKETPEEDRKKTALSMEGASLLKAYSIIPALQVKLPPGKTVFDAMHHYTYLPGVRHVDINSKVTIE